MHYILYLCVLCKQFSTDGYKPDDLRTRARDLHGPEKARAILAGLGGSTNIQQVESCAETRLRVTLQDSEKLDETGLKQAGVRGIMPLGQGAMHLLVGLNANQYAAEIRAAMSG